MIRGSRSESIRTVMDGLRRIVRDLRLSARDAERGAGISGAQLFVLQTLSESSAQSLNDLADRTLTDQSSVSVVVKRLVERKLVARKPSEEDGRRVELSLTSWRRSRRGSPPSSATWASWAERPECSSTRKRRAGRAPVRAGVRP